MKNKLLAFILVSVCFISGCGGSASSDADNSVVTGSGSDSVSDPLAESSAIEASPSAEASPDPSPSVDVPSNSQTIDGITVTANSYSIEPYTDESGEYTKRIAVNFTFTNNTNQAFGYICSCDGVLSDGYQLESYTDLMEMDLKQVPSGGSADMTAYLLANDTLDLSEITVSYDFMDYNQEYWDDLGKLLSGEMGQDEYTSKYSGYQVLEFTLHQ